MMRKIGSCNSCMLCCHAVHNGHQVRALQVQSGIASFMQVAREFHSVVLAARQQKAAETLGAYAFAHSYVLQ